MSESAFTRNSGTDCCLVSLRKLNRTHKLLCREIPYFITTTRKNSNSIAVESQLLSCNSESVNARVVRLSETPLSAVGFRLYYILQVHTGGEDGMLR